MLDLELPARYFRLLEAGILRVEERLQAEPEAGLETLEAQPGWRHFPAAILMPALLYTKSHPDNGRQGEPGLLSLGQRIGDLLATEHTLGRYTTRLDHDWDTYIWLEAYRLLEGELGEERRARWRRALMENLEPLVSKLVARQDYPWYNAP